MHLLTCPNLKKAIKLLMLLSLVGLRFMVWWHSKSWTMFLVL